MTEFDYAALLFWIEQELVESEAEIYMPADTPIHHQLPRVLYQKNKRLELKRLRAIERLKIYQFECLNELRERFAKTVLKDKLPGNKNKQFIETLQNVDYLNENLETIHTLINDIDKLQTDESVLEKIQADQTKFVLTAEQEEEKKLSDEFKHDYQEVLFESFKTQEEEIRNRYYTCMSLIKHNKENEQPTKAS